MSAPYGPLKKSKLSLLLFVVPAAALVGVSVAIAMMDGLPLGEAIASPVVLVVAGLSALILIWGGIFMSRPIVTLTPEGVQWPNGRQLLWSEVESLDAGQEITNAPNQSSGARQTTHEVTRLFDGEGNMTKITTTLAAIGPEAANAQIADAYSLSRQQL